MVPQHKRAMGFSLQEAMWRSATHSPDARTWAPYICERHSLRQMWSTTFDAGDPRVRFDISGRPMVDGAVRIEAADRAGRERPLRYCARPPFALERLRELDPERLVYDHPQPGPGARGALILTPFELLDRLAGLMAPPPRSAACAAAGSRAITRATSRMHRSSCASCPIAPISRSCAK